MQGGLWTPSTSARLSEGRDNLLWRQTEECSILPGAAGLSGPTSAFNPQHLIVVVSDVQGGVSI